MAQTGFLGVLGALLILFGVLLLLKAVLFNGAALAALAIALAVAYGVGVAGRWALWLAGALALLLLPLLFVGAIGFALGLAGALLALSFHLLPVLLLFLGAYLLFHALARR